MTAPDRFEPACICGVHGCPDAELHRTAYVADVPTWRVGGRRSRRHKRRR